MLYYNRKTNLYNNRMFNFTINVLKSNSIDWINAIIVLITAILSAVIAILVAYYNNKKQFEVFNRQIEEQQKQWKYDTLLKSKIEAIFELRRLFQKFEKDTLMFVGLFLPNGLRKGNKQLFWQDCLDMDADGVIPLFINTRYYDTFEEILNHNFKNANDLCSLLENNDIFFENNNALKLEELIYFVKGFWNFYVDLIMTKKYSNSILVKNDESVHEIKFDKDFNEYFLKFMHMRLPYTKNNIRTHVFFMKEPSIFSENNQCYTDENIKIWASNFKVLYSISQCIQYWLAITMTDINRLTEKYLPGEED